MTIRDKVADLVSKYTSGEDEYVTCYMTEYEIADKILDLLHIRKEYREMEAPNDK